MPNDITATVSNGIQLATADARYLQTNEYTQATIASTTNATIRGPAQLAGGLWVAFSPYTTDCEIRQIASIDDRDIEFTALENDHGSTANVLVLPYLVIPVELFGARGDGTTDDTASIQAAMDAAVTGMVRFSNGVYKITSPITLRSYTTILGAARDATIIYAIGCDGFTHVNASGGYYLTVQDLTIRGDYTAGKVGVKLTKSHRFTLGRVRVEKFSSHGIYMTDNIYISTISDCVVEFCDGDGIHMGPLATATAVRDTTCNKNNGAGIRLIGEGASRIYQIRISGCTIEQNRDSGIIADYCDAVSIEGCYFEQNAKVNTGAGRTNTGTPTTGYNIRLGNTIGAARGVTITGCWLTRARSNASSGNGYHIELGSAGGGAATDVFIAGNSLDSNETNEPLQYNGTVNNTRIVFSPANYIYSGFDASPVRAGSIMLSGTTGATVIHNFGNTSYIVTLTPTSSLNGHLYVSKSANDFTVYSSDADDGTCDYVIERSA